MGSTHPVPVLKLEAIRAKNVAPQVEGVTKHYQNVKIHEYHCMLMRAFHEDIPQILACNGRYVRRKLDCSGRISEDPVGILLK